MATAGKATPAKDETQPTVVESPKVPETNEKKGTDKAAKAAQATIDKYTNNKTAKANAEVGKVGEDK